MSNDEADSNGKPPSRCEKKARSMIAKLPLKKLTGISRVVIRKSKNIQFIKKKLETLKSGHAPSNSLNNRLTGPVLRAGSTLRANKVILLTFQYILCCNGFLKIAVSEIF